MLKYVITGLVLLAISKAEKFLQTDGISETLKEKILQGLKNLALSLTYVSTSFYQFNEKQKPLICFTENFYIILTKLAKIEPVNSLLNDHINLVGLIFNDPVFRNRETFNRIDPVEFENFKVTYSMLQKEIAASKVYLGNWLGHTVQSEFFSFET